jgi:hypothetical protein
MEYEFKSIVLIANVNKMLSETHSQTLNDYFSDGWEYVDSICQSFSISNDGFKGYGSVIVVLKKKIV